MNTAWETTTEDVLIVLQAWGIKEVREGKVELDSPVLDEIYHLLDCDSIEQARPAWQRHGHADQLRLSGNRGSIAQRRDSTRQRQGTIC